MKQNDVMQTLHHNGHKQKIDIETCINLCVTFSNVGYKLTGLTTKT